MLHEKLTHPLKETYERLSDEGRLTPLNKLQEYYALFRERFGPEALLKLDGEGLLTSMHSNGRNSLVYWLEFKNDETFPSRTFGSIAGGSALKFGVYQNSKSGVWMSRDTGNYPVEISLDHAIQIAHRHRDQLLHGLALLDTLPANGSDSDYSQLQKEMDEQVPDVSRVAWGHKYFHLLYPEKLDDFHVAYLQRFHLVKLLEPNIPDEYAGRYITGGRFVQVARELEMPMNHLATVLNAYNGRPHRYWSVLTSDPFNHQALSWEMQRDGGFTAITWSELDNLSDLKHDSPSKKLLQERIQHFYPRSSASQLQAVFSFVTDMNVGDGIVAFDLRSRRVVGVGKVTSDYYYEPSAAPHRRLVEWRETTPWQFPIEEDFDRVTREILIYANQVEIERCLLDATVISPLISQPISQNRLPLIPETLVFDEKSTPKIFISYRRKSWPFTHRLADDLAEHLDAEIFVDYTGIDETDFERSILRHLRDSDVVVLIISEHTFEDRIHRDDDWVRREIREALYLKKPIVLVLVEGRLPPANLPDDIKDVSRMQGVKFYPEYFVPGIEKLAKFIAKIDIANERSASTPLIPTPSIKSESSNLATSDTTTLDEALNLMDRGDFRKAIVFLEALRASGYKSRYIDLDDLLIQAQIGADTDENRQRAQLDYQDIVLLASRNVTFERARKAFALWCEDNPSLVDDLDTENLRKRFNII